jgi:hypothetical protein
LGAEGDVRALVLALGPMTASRPAAPISCAQPAQMIETAQARGIAGVLAGMQRRILAGYVVEFRETFQRSPSSIALRWCRSFSRGWLAACR